MNKVIRPYNLKINGQSIPVFCKIQFNDGKLSISGVVGPTRGGNCVGSCGQIIMDFKELDARGHLSFDDAIPVNGMTSEKIKMFLNIWDKYHLNDMSPACEHQREMGWSKEPYIEDRPITDYIKYPDGGQGWNSKGWLRPPYGHLTESCPVCGYKYGTAWKTLEIPKWVIEFLESIPDTDITPAWV